jgi:hypothetical protein
LEASFYQVANVPFVVGCVDGTDIKIDGPHIHEEAYVDRHSNHSMNLTSVCGRNMSFFWISIRWPGSVHDSRVLRNSSLWTVMENNTLFPQDAIILGDSAYPLTVSILINIYFVTKYENMFIFRIGL